MKKFQKHLFRWALLAFFLAPVFSPAITLKAEPQATMNMGNPNTDDIPMKLALDILDVAATILNTTRGDLVSQYTQGDLTITRIVSSNVILYKVSLDGIDIFILDSSL